MKMSHFCLVSLFGITAIAGPSLSIAQTDVPTETPPATPTPTPTATATTVVQSLFPISANYETLASAVPGETITNILDGGGQPGNIGWLSWTGNPSACTLCNSLVPPGDSNTYLNPLNPDDHQIDPGDFITGSSGVKNSSCVRTQLESLVSSREKIGIPTWDEVSMQGGNTALFKTKAFALVEITGFDLPAENSISAIFRGWTGLQTTQGAAAAESLSLDVFNGNSAAPNADDALDTGCLAVVSPESSPLLRWRIAPNQDMGDGDIIAGVLLPNGRILAFDAGFRNLRNFKKIGNTPRVAVGVPFSMARDGVITLSVRPSNSGGPFTIIAGVLAPGSNTLLTSVQSNPFMIR